MTTVHVLVPAGIDDPLRPSGGNVYDRRVCSGLTSLGWSVAELAVAGCWPDADQTSRARLADQVDSIADGSIVLVDGLIGSAAPDVLLPASARIGLAVLVHQPLGSGPRTADSGDVRAREGAILAAAAAVVVTSRWTQRSLVDHYALSADRIHVVAPGVDPAPLAAGTAVGTRLLCVGAVTPSKGHDVLLAALTQIADLPWECVLVGSLTDDSAFVDQLGKQSTADGVADRVRFAGPLIGTDLDEAYAAADLLVLASRAETYGMVVVEALARGIPVVVSDVGGLPEALGGVSGHRPGILVPPGDPAGLAAALRRWFVDPAVRDALRRTARQRRPTLSDWSTPAAQISDVLTRLAG